MRVEVLYIAGRKQLAVGFYFVTMSSCAIAMQSSRVQSSSRLELIDEDPVEQESVSVQVLPCADIHSSAMYNYKTRGQNDRGFGGGGGGGWRHWNTKCWLDLCA